MDIAASCSRARAGRRAGIATRSCRRNGRSCQNSISLRHHAIARPVRRPRHCADREFRRGAGDRLLEREPAFERGGLFARPGADLRHARARGEIGVGFFCGDTARHGRARGPDAAAISSKRSARPSAFPPARGPSRCRDSCRTRNRVHRSPSASTMRALGSPSASTVASVMASGLTGSARAGLGEPRREQPETARRLR